MHDEIFQSKSLLTPAQQIIPHEMLFFCKHRHNNESVQVDSFTEHPEVVAAQQIQVDEHEQFAGRLEGKSNMFLLTVKMPNDTWFSVGSEITHRIVVRVSLFLHHCCEPDNGDDGVEHEREEEVFVERYPLAAQTPEDTFHRLKLINDSSKVM